MNAHSSPKDSIFKMFLCFPSATKLDEETAGMMTAAYLETVRDFSSQTVSAACDALRRRNQPFPPSAGELYDACVTEQQRQKRHAEWRPAAPAPRLPAPRRPIFNDADLADWSIIINAPRQPYIDRHVGGAPLKIPAGEPGAGKEVFYGYLTQREMRAAGLTQTPGVAPPKGMKMEAAEYQRAVEAGEVQDFRTMDLPPMAPSLRYVMGIGKGAE